MQEVVQGLQGRKRLRLRRGASTGVDRNVDDGHASGSHGRDEAVVEVGHQFGESEERKYAARSQSRFPGKAREGIVCISNKIYTLVVEPALRKLVRRRAGAPSLPATTTATLGFHRCENAAKTPQNLPLGRSGLTASRFVGATVGCAAHCPFRRPLAPENEGMATRSAYLISSCDELSVGGRTRTQLVQEDDLPGVAPRRQARKARARQRSTGRSFAASKAVSTARCSTPPPASGGPLADFSTSRPNSTRG